MVAIAIANQKGGVGKTTVALGIAEVAMNRNQRVLVVDCDPQSNASAGLGVPAQHDKKSLADVLENEIEITQENINEYVVSSTWSKSQTNPIDVLAAHPRLTSVETHLSSDPIGACDRLDRGLSEIKDQYDLILFDCPPSVGLLTINALFAADKVLIVSAPSAWSSDGVESFIANVDRIASRRCGNPQIAGIVVNNVGRTRDGKYWESELKNRYKYHVETVSSRAAIAEAAAMSVPLKELGSRPGAAEAFENFDNVYMTIVGLTGDEGKLYNDNQKIVTAAI